MRADRQSIEKQLDANVKQVVEKLNRAEPGHCKDCKHFVPNDGRDGNPIGSFIAEQDPPADWGWCDRADSAGGDAKDKTSLAVARDFELYEAHLSISPEFGCIQFEAKEQA